MLSPTACIGITPITAFIDPTATMEVSDATATTGVSDPTVITAALDVTATMGGTDAMGITEAWDATAMPSEHPMALNLTVIMDGITAAPFAGASDGMEAFALGCQAKSLALKCTRVR